MSSRMMSWKIMCHKTLTCATIIWRNALLSGKNMESIYSNNHLSCDLGMHHGLLQQSTCLVHEKGNEIQSWILEDCTSEIYDDAYLMDLKLKGAMCIWRWDPGSLILTISVIIMEVHIGTWHTGNKHRWLGLESLLNG